MFLVSTFQIDNLEKLRVSIGTKNIAPVLRGILTNFFTLPKEKKIKIIKEICILDGKKITLVYRHFQLSKTQVEKLKKLKKEVGVRYVAPIFRGIIDNFFLKTKEEQIKIIKDTWWKE